DVDDVRAGRAQRREVRERLGLELLGERARLLEREVADSDDLDGGREPPQRRQGGLADVAGPDQSYATLAFGHGSFLCPLISSTGRRPAATRAAQVSPFMASERRRRASGPPSVSARATASSNSSAPSAIRQCSA